MTASLGAIIEGYRDCPETVPSLPGPTLLEEEVAAHLQRQVPFLERVRFCKNGSDATEGAVRVARRATGRSGIVTNSYHGSHSDLVSATAGKSGGILPGCFSSIVPTQSPQEIMQYLTRHGETIAAVLLEPLTPSCQDWRLAEIQALCQDKGALLILDEMITGWRVREGSAVPHIQADLYCFGKAIGGGMPLAVLGGKQHLMDLLLRDVFMSGTHAGEQASLLMARDTLTRIRNTAHFYSFLQAWGDQLGEALKGLVQGYPQRWTLLPSPARDEFVDTLARDGLLVGRDVFPMYAHQGQERNILETIREVRKEVGV